MEATMGYRDQGELDLRVIGGVVVDGINAPTQQDIGVRDGRIAVMGNGAGWVANKVLDASGLIVSPGFIDAHSHGDFIDLYGPEREDLVVAALRQGVTTQIVGNCGFSAFACNDGDSDALARHVAGLFGSEGRSWPTVGAYRAALTTAGMHMNVATLIGHGSLSSGLDPVHGKPPSNLADALAREVEAAVDNGAVGLSSGLVYVPGITANTEEMVAASSGLRGSGLPYVTHVRGETHDVVSSVREALEIAERAGVPLHISHHKVAGRRNWGGTHQTLGLIGAAQASGRDVTLDVYPYTAASTSLHTLFPQWVQADGRDAMNHRLHSSAAGARLRRDITEGLPGWENMLGAAGWDHVTVAYAPGASPFEGQSLAELGEQLGMSPLDAAVHLQLRAKGPITVVFDVLDEADVRRVLLHPSSMVGSDGIPLPGKPHPRWAGSFTRVLSRYVREAKVLTVGEAVRKMAVLPAQRFKLQDRGRIAVGAAADLVIFSPDEVADAATFEEPLAHPRGVRAVVVNGQVVIEDDVFTGIRAGEFLTHGAAAGRRKRGRAVGARDLRV
jgi:N-acyl-D-amino-acid deacylase